MAQSWRSIKNTESYNKGRAALRGDYLAGSYNKSTLADVGPHYRNCKAVYEKAKAREERPLSQRGYYEIARVLRKRDKRQQQTSHFIKPKMSLREKREKKFGYVTQEA